jgi:hypothetical protein
VAQALAKPRNRAGLGGYLIAAVATARLRTAPAVLVCWIAAAAAAKAFDACEHLAQLAAAAAVKAEPGDGDH